MACFEFISLTDHLADNCHWVRHAFSVLFAAAHYDSLAIEALICQAFSACEACAKALSIVIIGLCFSMEWQAWPAWNCLIAIWLLWTKSLALRPQIHGPCTCSTWLDDAYAIVTFGRVHKKASPQQINRHHIAMHAHAQLM